jgi:hypothetical protein
VPLGAHTWLVWLSRHRVLRGAQVMAVHVPPWHTWLGGHGDGVKAVPEVLHAPAVIESRHRVCPGVHTVGVHRPSRHASEEEHGAAVSAVPVELQISCTPLTGLQRSEKGMHTGGLHARVVASHPVEQNCRKAQALPLGVQDSTESPLQRFSPGVQMDVPDEEHTPLEQPRSHVCATTYPEPSGWHASTVLPSPPHLVVLGVHACGTHAPLLQRPAQPSLNS